MAVTLLPDYVPYQGAASADPSVVPAALEVAIGSHAYLVDLKEYRRTSIQTRREPQDQSIEPAEQSLNTEALWRRSVDNWFIGSGQLYLDNRFGFQSLYARTGETPSLRTRFYRSKGLDPWGEGALKLLPETERKATSANTNLAMVAVNGYVYVADGNSLKFTNAPTAGTWSLTTVTGTPASAVLSLTTDGNTVWAAYATGIFQTTAGAAAATALGAYVPSLVGYANGRLLAAHNNDLVEVHRDGTTTAVWTHPNPNFVWTVIASSPGAIYVAGNCGDQAEIYSVGVNPSTGALTTPVWASGLPVGETINALAFYGGAVFLGTSLGVRLAAIGAGNVLTYAAVIDAPGPVRAFAGYGRFVWFTWTNYVQPTIADPTKTVSATGLGRLDPSQFSQPNVAAYATDVMATDGTAGTVNAVIVVGNRRYFAVSANGFWGENANVVASGSMESGWVRYGTTEAKIVSSIDVRHDPLAGSVDLFLRDERNRVTQLASSVLPGSLGTGPVAAGAPVGEAFMVNVVLNRSLLDATAGPVVRRWTSRALVTPTDSDEIIVPLIVRSEVLTNQGDGTPVHYDPLAEYQYLQSLKATGAIVRYQEGAASYSVYVDRIEVKPDHWTDGRDFFEGTITVRLVTVQGA